MIQITTLIHDIIIIRIIVFLSIDAEKASGVIFLLSTVKMVDYIDFQTQLTPEQPGGQRH